MALMIEQNILRLDLASEARRLSASHAVELIDVNGLLLNRHRSGGGNSTSNGAAVN